MSQAAAFFRLLVAGFASLLALVVAVPVLLLAVPFWVVAALVGLVRRILLLRSAPEVEWTDLIEAHPEVGWKNRGGARVRIRLERAFQVTTDPDGWRGEGTIEEADVLVFGDSFAFGHGIDDRHFFADRSSAARVKGIGANGYNMVQELLWMEQLRDHLRNKLVVWFVFYGNDLLDNLHPNFRHYRAPFVRSGAPDGKWEVVTEHVRAEPWPFQSPSPGWGYDRTAEPCCDSFQSQRAYSAARFLLERGQRVCHEAGATLVVAGIPDVETLDRARLTRLRKRASDPESFDPGLPDLRMTEICDGLGAPFLPLSTILTVHDHLPNDCHWTPSGHARVSRALDRVYRDFQAGILARGAPVSSEDRLPVQEVPRKSGVIQPVQSS
jgi:hypothetical protein